MKFVLNKCYGGYSLSPQAALLCYERGLGNATPVAEFYGNKGSAVAQDLARFRENPQTSWIAFTPDGLHVLDTRPRDRSNPILVAVVEELGQAANGQCADLRVVDVPEVAYEIDEYDGIETIQSPRVTYG